MLRGDEAGRSSIVPGPQSTGKYGRAGASGGRAFRAGRRSREERIVAGVEIEGSDVQAVSGKDALAAAGVAKPVIFFDDVCVMCNSFVNLLLRVDRRQQFLFAPLRGETARKLLPPLPDDPSRWSMVYFDESGIHDESDASLEVYRRLGGAWWLLSLARFIPAGIRNPVYRVIARNRYRWFGKRDSCRLPSAEEKARFLE